MALKGWNYWRNFLHLRNFVLHLRMTEWKSTSFRALENGKGPKGRIIATSYQHRTHLFAQRLWGPLFFHLRLKTTLFLAPLTALLPSLPWFHTIRCADKWERFAVLDRRLIGQRADRQFGDWHKPEERAAFYGVTCLDCWHQPPFHCCLCLQLWGKERGCQRFHTPKVLLSQRNLLARGQKILWACLACPPARRSQTWTSNANKFSTLPETCSDLITVMGIIAVGGTQMEVTWGQTFRLEGLPAAFREVK